MTIQTNDPISEIQKAEGSAEKKLEDATKNFDEQLLKFDKELAEKREEFEKGLKEQGNKKLETVKNEAGELFKSKMATSEKEKNDLSLSATEKQDKAVDAIVESFLDHIKA